MGFFKKLSGSKAVEVDPADLTLPEIIPTDKSGVSFRKSRGEKLVDINIVGESFRPKNVAAVAVAADGKMFDIYLIAEPTNQYDKNAVAVYAANLHIGYIAKPDNKQWFKWVREAFERQEVLWGTARAVTRQGTTNTGIFGSIYMPSAGPDINAIISQKMSDSVLGKNVEKAITLANNSYESDTIAQLKSLSKKAIAVATPFVAHARWVQENPDGQDIDTWNEVMGVCEDIFDNASDAAYATDAEDVDIVSTIDALGELVQKFRSQ